MKTAKRVLMNFVLMLLLFTLTVPIIEADAVVDSEKVNLKIEYAYSNEKIPNANFSIYYVADIDGLCRFTLAGDFHDYPLNVNLKTEDYPALAQTIYGYILLDKIKPTSSGKTDNQGELVFTTAADNLKQGMYLVMADNLTMGEYKYKSEPYLVSLPLFNYKNKKFEYNVTSYPKCEREKNTYTTDTDSDSTTDTLTTDTDTTTDSDNPPTDTDTNTETDYLTTDTDTTTDSDNPPTDTDTNTETDYPITDTDTTTDSDNPPTDTDTETDSDNNSTSISVLKKWDDKGHEEDRTKSVTVTLFENGKVYDSVELNESNNWYHTWNGINSESDWYVAETPVPNYTVLVEKQDSAFIVKNTRSDSDSDTDSSTYSDNDSDTDTVPSSDVASKHTPSLPQTGTLWWAVPVLLALGLVIFFIGFIVRRGSDDE